MPLQAQRWRTLQQHSTAWSLHTVATPPSTLLKFYLIPSQQIFSYCKRSVGDCKDDVRAPVAGSPVLAGDADISASLSSNKVLKTTCLLLRRYYSHPHSISQEQCFSRIQHPDLLFCFFAALPPPLQTPFDMTLSHQRKDEEFIDLCHTYCAYARIQK